MCHVITACAHALNNELTILRNIPTTVEGKLAVMRCAGIAAGMLAFVERRGGTTEPASVEYLIGAE